MIQVAVHRSRLILEHYRNTRFKQPCGSPPPRYATKSVLTIDDLVVKCLLKGFRRAPYRAFNGVPIDGRSGECVGLVGNLDRGRRSVAPSLATCFASRHEIHLSEGFSSAR